MRNYRFLKSLVLFTAFGTVYCFAQGYHKTGSILIGGTGGWDYLTVDNGGHRMYVSHGTEVAVVDLASQKVVGKITGMKRVHGIALADDMNTGFISDGGSNQVVVFDLKDLTVKSKVAAGTNPDGIVYDDASKHVFAFNGGSKDATAIDAATAKVSSTIPLGGKPEFPVADGRGNVYDNIESKNEIVAIDSNSGKVKAHWSITPCESPSGLAIDTKGHRLFAVCDNKMMAVVNSDSGKVVQTMPIGEGPDAAAYDPGTGEGFSSNGEDGTLTVVKKSGKDKYAVAETVETTKGARTMALDTHTHTVYLATADMGAPTANGQGRPRPSIVPNTFKVLVFSK